ncbi:MAG: ATP-binding protein [Syntrophus sp. (in: bacteria)]|nr:ATP-binding protein [Syntrophus sp. (in: bacteria)]
MKEIEKPGSITFVIDSRLENVSFIGVAARGICNYLSLNEMDTYYVELCLAEAVTNAIQHAYQLKPGYSVEVNLLFAGNSVTLRICDSGEPTDLKGEACAFAFDPERPQNVPERGMGLFLIHKLMDEVLYERIDGKNILSFKRYLIEEECS